MVWRNRSPGEADMDTADRARKLCPNCGGSGNLSTFHGESRFMLTHEECPFCCGFGYVLEDEEPEAGRAEAKGGSDKA